MDWWIQLAKQRQKITLRKVWVCYFFSAVYYSRNYVILHPVIAAIMDVILNITKRKKKKQQYANQVLQIQPLLKTIGTMLLTAIRLNFAFKLRPSWTPSKIFEPSEPNQFSILIFWVIRPLISHKKSNVNPFYRVHLSDRSLEHYWRPSWTPFLIFQLW